MPAGIPYIVGNEAAERFSFYGMKAILAVFMVKYLVDSQGQPAGMTEEEAKVWVHNFVTAAYFFPILGAIVSDWLFGKYRTIIALSLVYCAGHAVLALMDSPVARIVEPRDLLWWGLALIAVGSGGIKPCVSAHVGDQFGTMNRHRLPQVFGWFYFSINLGATASTLLTPIVLEKFGPGWAFGIPGILMGLATLIFWMGRYRFVHIPAAGNRFFRETFDSDGLRAMANLIRLYIFIAVFWSLFDQTASAWVLQAEHMNRVLFDGSILGYSVHWEARSAQIQAANPILVMLLIPLFTYVVYPTMERYFRVTPLRKIGIGLFVTVPAFALPAWIEMRIVAGETPHFAWQLLAYVIMTCAEVMVSITALEFSYTQAPPRMKSFIMGLYLLSVAVGNQFTAQVNDFIRVRKEQGMKLLEGANYYWFFTAVMLLTALVYTVFARFYRGRTYIQGEDSSAENSALPQSDVAPAPGTTEA